MYGMKSLMPPIDANSKHLIRAKKEKRVEGLFVMLRNLFVYDQANNQSNCQLLNKCQKKLNKTNKLEIIFFIQQAKEIEPNESILKITNF